MDENRPFDIHSARARLTGEDRATAKRRNYLALYGIGASAGLQRLLEIEHLRYMAKLPASKVKFRQTTLPHLKLTEPVFCPWCHRNQDDHEQHQQRTSAQGCEFRFAAPDSFVDGKVICLWMHDHLLGVYENNQRGYALALILLEDQVQRHSDNSAWAVRMQDGLPRGFNGPISRLEMTRETVRC